MALATPSAFMVHFSRQCPRGLAVGTRDDPRPIKGTIRVVEYDEEGAMRAAQFILDRYCVIDRVEPVER